jgi:iron complex transport system substrate-binding protein
VRIVSLLPSATEIVFALGLGDSLDGVTGDCDFPPEAERKPVVSESALPQGRQLSAGEVDRLVAGFMDRQESIYRLDKDLIRQIQPDLILAQDLCRVCAVPSGQVEDALKELGTSSTVLSLDPNTLDEVLGCITDVAEATGTQARGEELVAGLRARIDRIKAAAARLPTIRTFCLEWSDPPYVAGHWIPGMVEVAGGTNLLAGKAEPPDPSPSRAVTWRQIGDAGPEVIVFMPCGYYLEEAEAEAEGLFAQPDFAGTPAARIGAVFAVEATSYFSRPGPRLVDGLEILAWAIHPEAFPEPPGGTIARVRG